jgi:hypothetical protein
MAHQKVKNARFKPSMLWDQRMAKDPVTYDPDGPSLTITFIPKGERSPFDVNANALLRIERCAVDFAQALCVGAKRLRVGSLVNEIQYLKSWFLAFLEEEGLLESLEIQDINTTLLNRFTVDFLGKKDSKGVYVIGIETRNHALGVVRKIVGGLRRLRRSLPDDCEVQKSPWARTYEDPSRRFPEDSIDSKKLADFFRCVHATVKATMEDVEDLWRQEKAEKEDISECIGAGWEESTALCCQPISLAKQYFGPCLPQRSEVQSTPLWPIVAKFGYTRMARAFGPYTADLAPFVYYLLFLTGLNQQPLVDLKISAIDVLEFDTREVLVVEGIKHRAQSDNQPMGKYVPVPMVLGNDPMSPGRVIQFLLKWTQGLRPAAEAKDSERLFLYQWRDRTTGCQIRSYAHGPSPVTRFSSHASIFCKQNGFPWTGEKRIRKLFSAIAHQVAKGDIEAVASMMHHASIDTTNSHYVSEVILRHGQEFLARGLNLRHRWTVSNGRIEPRNVHAEHDRSAATPGFTCIDPFDSPVLGQISGSMCTAFGDCPDCPFGMVDLRSSYAAARCVELKAKISEKRCDLSTEEFEVRWGRVLRALENFWIPAFDESIWELVRYMDLPPIPDLE